LSLQRKERKKRKRKTLSGPEERKDEVDVEDCVDGILARTNERRVVESINPEEAVEPLFLHKKKKKKKGGKVWN